MQLRLHNTLSGETEAFVPLDPAGRKVSFYTCGPTVYDYAHIGNFRAFLNADVLRRTLEALGFEVQQVMNITDVGHMTEDTVADGGGEDKMQVAADRLSAAKKAGTLPKDTDIDPEDPFEVAAFYADAFLEDAALLGMKVVQDGESRMPRPTGFIEPMIAMVQSLIDRGHAYVAADGVVYFDVQSFPDYGLLSGNTLEAIRSGEGGRVDMGTQAIKRHPADFMLWKPDATHIMRWPSPWGEGYPGWHLECSTMAAALLGHEIDIHSGGEDNIFPHHECEIAQSRCSTGDEYFAKYWYHTRFLLVDGGKMSKSKGNFYTVRDLIAKGASPAAIRIELIRTHYRSNANFTLQGLRDAQRQIDRWQRLRHWLEQYATADGIAGPLRAAQDRFMTAMCDDLNVAGAVGALNEGISEYDTSSPPDQPIPRDELAALMEMDQVLGVLDLGTGTTGDIDTARVEQLIGARNAARAAKDWDEADRIRAELTDMGVAIKDEGAQTRWSRLVQ
ncbi:MAG: cysteine--tRNA ligase [Phycisphaerales bacterium]|jgi:cysteinyl-tRNA synthetase|nr:cysteine--tRNA ligase [Phycisphaerales bacterium]